MATSLATTNAIVTNLTAALITGPQARLLRDTSIPAQAGSPRAEVLLNRGTGQKRNRGERQEPPPETLLNDARSDFELAQALDYGETQHSVSCSARLSASKKSSPRAAPARASCIRLTGSWQRCSKPDSRHVIRLERGLPDSHRERIPSQPPALRREQDGAPGTVRPCLADAH